MMTYESTIRVITDHYNARMELGEDKDTILADIAIMKTSPYSRSLDRLNTAAVIMFVNDKL
ncbi:MAG: hypothetical protein MJ245_00510 [Clostridia bacterium]|nr:hypothetical protein [Clostridia bacterium]